MALVAGLVDGGDGIAVSFARLDGSIAIGSSREGWCRGDASPGDGVGIGIGAVDDVAGEILLGIGFPGQVEGFVFRDVDGDESVWNGGWKGVDDVDLNGRGDFAGQLQIPSSERSADKALRGVLVGFAEVGRRIDGSRRWSGGLAWRWRVDH